MKAIIFDLDQTLVDSRHIEHLRSIEAMNRLKIEVRDFWAVGDDSKDIIAAKASGMYAVAALWGSLDKESLKRSKPDAIFETVTSFYKTICNYPSRFYH